MNITLPRADLARLLASTVRVVESRNTIPILSMVRVVADGGKLAITATDLDIEVRAAIDVDADADGAVCVSASMLDGIVKKLPPNNDVTLTADGQTLTVKSGRSKFTLQTLPVADFPSFTAGKYTTEFEADLAALMAPCAFAISTEETRFYLNGVYLHTKGGNLAAVATDGHRLARHIADYEVPDFKGIIIPRKLVGLVPKGDLAVSLSDTKIRLVAGDTTITSKLIDGTFPDYERIIPTGNDKTIVFDAAAMRIAAERVSVVSSERGRAVKLSFASGSASLAVRNDGEEATDELSVAYDGEPIEIGFNSAYLGELIANFPAGEVTLALADAASPSIFTAKSAPGLMAILMPMRV